MQSLYLRSNNKSRCIAKCIKSIIWSLFSAVSYVRSCYFFMHSQDGIPICEFMVLIKNRFSKWFSKMIEYFLSVQLHSLYEESTPLIQQVLAVSQLQLFFVITVHVLCQLCVARHVRRKLPQQNHFFIQNIFL